jgi:hypothetical protein
VALHGALRDAAVLRRMAMRTTSRDEQVARKCLSGFAGPRWCALTLGAYGRPQSNASRTGRLQPTVLAKRALLAVALMGDQSEACST